MGEGWENARRRDDGNDWVELGLAGCGEVRLLELDTSYFLYNAPGAAEVSGCDETTSDPAVPASWFTLLERVDLRPDTRHRFVVAAPRPATRLRVDVFPDGGLARLRAHGRLTADGHEALWVRWFNTLPRPHLRAVLEGLGMPGGRVDAVLAGRPVEKADELPAELADLVR